jgi:transcriptional regulator of aromatic amino acid metabolism
MLANSSPVYQQYEEQKTAMRTVLTFLEQDKRTTKTLYTNAYKSKFSLFISASRQQKQIM